MNAFSRLQQNQSSECIAWFLELRKKVYKLIIYLYFGEIPLRVQTQLIAALVLTFSFGCQTSRKSDSEAKEDDPKKDLVDCTEELFLECEPGQIDRCVFSMEGKHECIEKPAEIVFKCDEAIGYNCPKGEVDRCSFEPKGNHECVPDPRLAKDFPQGCKKDEFLKCEDGYIDACELDPKAEPKCVPHRKEYLIKFRTPQSLRLTAESLPKSIPGARTLGQYLKSRMLHVSFKSMSVVNSAIELAKILGRDDVEYITENVTLRANTTPTDPRYADQWQLAKIGAVDAWSQNTGDREIVVAVIDTGVDYNHPDLAANMFRNSLDAPGDGVDNDQNGYVDDHYGWDFYDDDNDPMDETSSSQKGHGTHCAGIVGAVGNNGIGVVGASQKVTILPVRFLGPKGDGSLIDAVKAIDYATDMGVDIISASFGVSATASQVKPILEAIERAEEKGIIFVAAASNDGRNNDTNPVYPANAPYENVISVAASNQTDGKPSWSNFGEKVHIAAPGNEILSTLPDGKYGIMSGTSMAAPMVAGTAALLLAQNRALEGQGVSSNEFAREVTSSPANIRSLLQASGKKVGINTSCDCRLDASTAFSALNGNGLFVSPSSAQLVVDDQVQLNVYGGDGNYTFTSQNANIVSVDATGNMRALAPGLSTITVRDGGDRSVESFSYRVVAKGVEESGQCPLSWPRVCSIVCYFIPTVGWCG